MAAVLNTDGMDELIPLEPRAPRREPRVEPPAPEPAKPRRKWQEVQADPRFQALSSDDQEAARAQYFDEVVAPQVDETDVSLARKQFDQETRPGRVRQAAHDAGRVVGGAAMAAKGILDRAADAAGPTIDAGLQAIQPPPVRQLSPETTPGWTGARRSSADPSHYDDVVNEASRQYGLRPELLRGMLNVENAPRNPQAVSPKGARGLMQLMPGTAAELGVTNPDDPRQSIYGGAKYMRQLLDKYHGDERLALAAYNAGPGAVDRAGGIPDKAETRNYVDKVLGGAASVDRKPDPRLSSDAPEWARGLNPALMPKVEQLINQYRARGIDLRVASGRRDLEEQKRLYAQGRTAPGPIVTWTAPEKSRHVAGDAVDLVPFVNGKPDWHAPEEFWQQLGRDGVAMGLEWGGNWKKTKDRPHFQLPKGAAWTPEQARTLPQELYGLPLQKGYIDTVRAKWDAAGPGERARMLTSDSEAEARVARFLRDGYAQADRFNDPVMSLLDGRREKREEAYRFSGADPESARRWADTDLKLGIDRRKDESLVDRLPSGRDYLMEAAGLTQRTGQAGLSGLYGLSEGVLGTAEAGAGALSQYVTGPLADAGFLPEDAGARVEAGLREWRAGQTWLRKHFTPQAESDIEAGFYSGIQSLAQNIPGLAASLATGNPLMALGSMTASTGGQAYGEARDQGKGRAMALTHAASQALIEYGTEALPVAYLLKDMAAGTPFFKMLWHQLATEMPGEQVATSLQDLMQWATLNPEKTGMDYLRERPSAVNQTLIATLVGVGGHTALAKGMEKMAEAPRPPSKAGALASELQAAIDKAKLPMADANTGETITDGQAATRRMDPFSQGQPWEAPKTAGREPWASQAQRMAAGGVKQTGTGEFLGKDEPAKTVWMDLAARAEIAKNTHELDTIRAQFNEAMDKAVPGVLSTTDMERTTQDMMPAIMAIERRQKALETEPKEVKGGAKQAERDRPASTRIAFGEQPMDGQAAGSAWPSPMDARVAGAEWPEPKRAEQNREVNDGGNQDESAGADVPGTVARAPAVEGTDTGTGGGAGLARRGVTGERADGDAGAGPDTAGQGAGVVESGGALKGKPWVGAGGITPFIKDTGYHRMKDAVRLTNGSAWVAVSRSHVDEALKELGGGWHESSEQEMRDGYKLNDLYDKGNKFRVKKEDGGTGLLTQVAIDKNLRVIRHKKQGAVTSTIFENPETGFHYVLKPDMVEFALRFIPNVEDRRGAKTEEKAPEAKADAKPEKPIEIPDAVKRALDFHISGFQGAAQKLRDARSADAQFGGGGRYASEVWDNAKLEDSLKVARTELETLLGSFDPPNRAAAQEYIDERMPKPDEITLTRQEREFFGKGKADAGSRDDAETDFGITEKGENPGEDAAPDSTKSESEPDTRGESAKSEGKEGEKPTLKAFSKKEVRAGDLIEAPKYFIEIVRFPSLQVNPDGLASVDFRIVKKKDKDGRWVDQAGRNRNETVGAFVRLFGVYPTADAVPEKQADERARGVSPVKGEPVATGEKQESSKPLSARAQQALEVLREGGYFRKQLHTQYRGGEKFEMHLYRQGRGLVKGVGFAAFYELQDAGLLTSRSVPKSSVWAEEWVIAKQPDAAEGVDPAAGKDEGLPADVTLEVTKAPANDPLRWKFYALLASNKPAVGGRYSEKIGGETADEARQKVIDQYHRAMAQRQKEAAKTAETTEPLAAPSPASAEAMPKEEAGTPVHRAAGFGANNTLFTKEDADAAREILRKKLSQLNAGLDPEMLAAGMRLAGYYVEGGARRWADYVQAMVDDLGEAVRPYLRSFYEGVRHYPGLDKAGLESSAALDQAEALDVWPGDVWRPKNRDAQFAHLAFTVSHLDAAGNVYQAGDYAKIDRAGVADLKRDFERVRKAGGAEAATAEASAPPNDVVDGNKMVDSPIAPRPSPQEDEGETADAEPKPLDGAGKVDDTQAAGAEQVGPLAVEPPDANDKHGLYKVRNAEGHLWASFQVSPRGVPKIEYHNLAKLDDDGNNPYRDVIDKAIHEYLTSAAVMPPIKRRVSKQKQTEAQDVDRETSRADGGAGVEGAGAGVVAVVDGPGDTGGVSGGEGGGDVRAATGTGEPGILQDSPVESGAAGTAAAGNRGHTAGVGASVANVPDVPRGNDYRIPVGGLTREGSWLDTARRNVEIVELVNRLTQEGRPATADEQALLVKFTGWGAADIRNQLFHPRAGTFHRYNPAVLSGSWRDLGERVAAVFTKEDWKTVLRSTQYAHYTSEAVVRAAWQGVERLGFAGGVILEPGAGIGHFAGLMPDGIYRESKYLGIEMDGFTAKIAQLLYPGQTIRHADYVRSKVPKMFDLAIGNPPFASTAILDDPEYARQKFPLHDYFFAKSLDRVRPGGLLVFVTSRFSLDKKGDRARRYLAERADLLGAIRLPNTAFKANAGTQVVTDILFLRRRAPGQAPAGESWLGLETMQSIEGEAVPVNEYFARHPEMILGQVTTRGDTLNPGEAFTVNPAGELEPALSEAIQRLPANVYSVAGPDVAAGTTQRTVIEKDWNPKYRKEGGLYLNDAGELMRVESGAGAPLSSLMRLTAKEQAWLTDYVGVRDALKQAQYDQLSDGDWEASLKALKKVYAAFVKQHGPMLAFTQTETTKLNKEGEEETVISRRFKNDRLLRADIDGKALMTALEVIREDGSIAPGAVLQGRVLKRPAEPKIESVDDALAVSLAQTGRFDLAHVARLAGLEVNAALERLGDLVFETPEGGHVLAEEYLSGDVRTKLDEAEAAAALHPRFARNVEALTKVQPPALASADVTVGMGATWVPLEFYQQYAQEVVGLDKPSLKYNPVSNEFEVSSTDRPKLSRRESEEWGTAYRSPVEVFDAAMNHRTVKVYVGSGTTNDPKRLDPEETKKVELLVRRMEENFSSWVWTDSQRTARVLDIYNDKFNRLAPRFFNGDHLNPPGLSLRYDLHKHQKRAIWRAIVTGNTYFAHAVGAGKTLEMIIAGMEQKRLGLINKPMYVVPNHMLEQFASEFMDAYPAANIMVADEKNFAADNRRRFIAQAALNNPDAIIITHSAFTILEMKPENMQAAFDDVIDDLRATLEELPDDFENRKTRGKIEAQLEKIERAMSGSSTERFTQRKKLQDLQRALEEMRKKLVDYQTLPGVTKAKLAEAKETIAKQEALIQAQAAKARTEELNAERDRSVLFEDMGVDFLFVDEAHEFRKLDYSTKMNIKGISPEGSVMALKLFVKTRWLEKQRPGRSFAFASGTPITNTLAELFTIQRFFQERQLRALGLIHFDAWAANFARVKTEYERNATGAWEAVDRLSKFVNVADLMAMVKQQMDVLTSSELAHLVKLPNVIQGNAGKRDILVTPRVPELDEYMSGELARRLKASREWKPSKDEPNNPDPVVAIITDGRVSALDMRYIDPRLPNNPDSKLNRLADVIIQQYRETADLTYIDPETKKVEPVKGGTQIVFASLGFGPGIAQSRGFDGRAWLNKRLRAAGIPASEVAWIWDYPTAAAKQAMFKEMRQGKKRILIGSPKNMGTGVNVQKRLTHKIDVDAPWYPADMEQPDGRILRQGNQNEWVKLVGLATDGTYDSTMYSMVARKSGFIEQAFRGDRSLRVMDDISESSQYAMAAAIASGDPRYVQMAELESAVAKLEGAKELHERRQASLRADIGRFKGNAPILQKAVESARKVQEALEGVIFYSGYFDAVVAGQSMPKVKTTDLGAAVVAVVDREYEKAMGIVQRKALEDNRLGSSEHGGPTHTHKFQAVIGTLAGKAELVLSGKVGAYRPKNKAGQLEKTVSLTYESGAEVHVRVAGTVDSRSVDHWQANPPASRALLAGGAITDRLNDLQKRALARRREALDENQEALEKAERAYGAPFPEQAKLVQAVTELAQLRRELAGEGKEVPEAAVKASVLPDFRLVRAAPKGGDRQAAFLAEAYGWPGAEVGLGRAVGNSLAESLVVGHAARVKGDIAPNRIVDAIRFSQPKTLGQGYTPDGVRAAIDASEGKGFAAALEKTGWFHIITGDQVPADVRAQAGGDRIPAYTWKGQVYLVADEIHAGDSIPGLLRHEVAVHAMRLNKSDAEFRAILQAMRRLPGERAAKAWAAVPKQTPGHLRDEEALAYFIEQNPTHSLTRRFLAWLRSAIRALARRLPGVERGRWLTWAHDLSEDELIAMANSALRSAVRGDGALTGEELAKFTFGGEKAVTADRFALESARARLDTGEDAEQVRQETGWFKGKDGKWRFEINDADARFQPRAMSKLWDGALLGEVIDHPALFAAYPTLAKLRVRLQDKKGAAFDGKTITVYGGLGATEERMLSDILHEIQHGLQDIEGFAIGGNPDTALPTLIRSINRPVLETNDEYQQLLFDEAVGDLTAQSKQRLQELRDLRQSVDGEIERVKADQDADYKAYRRLYGEVEARNVQARQGFSDARRRATPVSATQDVPDSDVIVTFNGKDMASAPRPANAGLPETISVDGVERPTRNSEGRVIHPTEAGVRNFWRWFAGSRVVDEQGRPLVVYKGGPTENWRDGSPIKEFKSPNGPWAGFFTNSADVANKFAEAQFGMTKHGGAPAGVFPVYLNLSNPLVIDAGDKLARDFQIDASVVGAGDSSVRERLLSGQYDGLVLSDTQDEGTVYVTLQSTQAKSAIGNTGAFSPTNPDIRFSRRASEPKSPHQRIYSAADPVGVAEKELQQIDAAVAGAGGWGAALKRLDGRGEDSFRKMSAWARRERLGAFTVHQLVDVGTVVLPRMEEYRHEMSAMDATRNRLIHESGVLAKRWGALPKKEIARVGYVMHESTIAGVDGSDEEYQPSIDIQEAKQKIKTLQARQFGAGGDKQIAQWQAEVNELRARIQFELNRRKEWDRVKGLYEALSTEGQAVYRAVRDYHSDHLNRVQDALVQMIEKTRMTGKQKYTAIQQLKEEFELLRVQAPYFPLGRFGDYWVHVAEETDPRTGNVTQERIFEKFETREEADAFYQEQVAAGRQVARGKQLENLREVTGVSATFVAQVEDLIGELGAENPEVADLRDQVYQLYLKTLPEVSSRKHAIHRGKVAGYAKDALRVFANKAFHDAYQYARIRHGFELREIMEQLQADVAAAGSAAKVAEMAARRALLEGFRDEVLAKKMTFRATKERAVVLDAQAAEIMASAKKRRLTEGEQFVIDEAARWNQYAAWFGEWHKKRKPKAMEIKRMTEAQLERELSALDLREQTIAAIQAHPTGHEFAPDLLNELQKAYQWLMNPTTGRVASVINALSFGWHLALSPAAWIVNTTQVPLITMPYVAARHGVVKTEEAFRQALGESLQSAWRWNSRKEHRFGIREALTRQDEIDAYNQALDRGRIDRGRVMDLIGLAEEGVDRLGGWQTFGTLMALGFHEAERLNREVSFMAAYRLARDAGQSFMDAVDYADKVVRDTHFVYDAENRARWMRGDAARVLLQFKSYAQHVTFLQWNMVRAALGDAPTPEAKAEARKFLMVQTAVQLAAGGVMGLPLGVWATMGAVAPGLAAAKRWGYKGALLYTFALMGAAVGLGGDDPDDPVDWWAEFEQAMADAFGATGGQAVGRGLVNAVGGIDLSSRVSMRELWWRDIGKDIEERSFVSDVLTQAVGPGIGSLVDIGEGLTLAAQGQTYRGIERMVPKQIRDGMQAVRFFDEGALTLKGDPLIEELTPLEILARAAGFTPSRLTARYAENQAEKQRESRIESRRQRLQQDIAEAGLARRKAEAAGEEEQAAEAEDRLTAALERAKRYNQKQPQYPITPDSLSRSVKGRLRARILAKDGVFMNRRIPERYEFAPKE